MLKLPSVFVWFSFLFLLFSVLVGWIIGPYLIRDQIIRLAKLQNGTYIWSKWKNPTNEMTLRVYFFNVSNPEDVEIGGVPIFQELGPYTYEERRYKENIIYNEDKDSLSYTQPVTYYFRPDLSPNVSETDLLTMINLPLVGVSEKLHGYTAFIRYMVGTFLSHYEEPLFVQRTVKEMLFDGYYNEMVEELQGLTGENFFPHAMVGILVGRNNSDEGEYEVNSGRRDWSKLGEMVSYNGDSVLPAWPSEPCNMINGTEGSVLPPLLDKDAVIRGFHPDVCRSLYITYVGQMTSAGGIGGLRFEPPESQYFSAKRNPDNWCFCPDEEELKCYEDGVWSGAGCHREGPITISNPHFLYAPFYLNKTIGLNPDKEKHGLFVEVEPTSGLILQASRRMQINADVRPNDAVPGMRKVPAMQFPLLWVDESFSIDQDIQDGLLSLLLLGLGVLDYGKWVCLGSSLLLLLGASVVTVLRARRKPYIYS